MTSLSEKDSVICKVTAEAEENTEDLRVIFEHDPLQNTAIYELCTEIAVFLQIVIGCKSVTKIPRENLR